MAVTFSRGSVNDAGVEEGKSFPLGAGCRADGVSFSLYSKDGTAVELLLFDRADDALPSRTILLDPAKNRTYYYWHVFVPGLRAGQIYGYRVAGPSMPERGFRFDPSKVLLDPYGKGVVVPESYSRRAASEPGENTATAMKSVVVDPAGLTGRATPRPATPGKGPSSTKCTWAGSPATRVPASRPTSAAPTSV
jgi:isoamylase